MTEQVSVDRLEEACRAQLGPADQWVTPGGHNSLALCLLDCIWSLGAHYDHHVVPVLQRYRDHRNAEGADANSDSPTDLLSAIDRVGGAQRFAVDVLRNEQRTSTRGNSVLKAEAVQRAALIMRGHGIGTPADFRAAVQGGVSPKVEWRSIPGQRSSYTGWRYLLILTGIAEVKPDRMILAYVKAATGRSVTPDEAGDLVTEVSARLGVRANQLDHQIWLRQSGRIPTDELG